MERIPNLTVQRAEALTRSVHMAMNRVQFHPGLSFEQCQARYGTVHHCGRAPEIGIGGS